VKTAKEEATKKLEALKGKTDETSKTEMTNLEAEIKKYEAMLITLDSSKTELTTLKGTIDQTVLEKAAQENLDKTASADKTKVDVAGTDKEKKWWLKRQIDWFSDKTEDNHVWKNVGRIAAGVWVGVLVYKWLKRIFGRGKKKEEKKDGETEEKGFRETWVGKFLKWTGIWTWVYYLIHGFSTGRWWIKDFFDRSKKAWYESNDPKKFDEIYEKESKEDQVKHDELWKAVNEFFTWVYGSETWATWSDMLWEQSGDDKFDSHVWTMPAALDDKSSNVGDILDNTSDFEKKLDEFGAKVSKDVGKQINPLNRFSGSGASDEDLAKLDKEDLRKYQAYRKTLKVQVFLKQKEKVLVRRLVAEKLGITDYATASETLKATYDEKIDTAMDDTKTMSTIETKMKTLYYNKKLTEVMAVLKTYNITNEEMVPDTEKSLKEIDQDENDLIWDTLDKATASADINSDATLKTDVTTVCDDFDTKMNDEDNQLIDFDNFFIGLGDAWLNMEAGDKKKVLEEIWYTEKIGEYSTKVLAIKEKIKNGTATKADMTSLKKTIDDYYMFKKDIMLGISFVHEADEKKGGVGRTLLYLWGKFLGVIERVYDAAWGGIIWFTVAGLATLWGLYVAGKVIKGGFKYTATKWLSRIWSLWKDPGKVLPGRRLYRYFQGDNMVMKALRRQAYKWDKWYKLFETRFKTWKIDLSEAQQIIDINGKWRTTTKSVDDLLKEGGYIVEWDTVVEKKLIRAYFDKNINFRKALKWSNRSKMLTLMKDYDSKITTLVKAWEAKKAQLLEDMFTYARFKKWDELQWLLNHIDDVGLSEKIKALEPQEITSLAKNLSKKISSTTTVDEITASIADAKKAATTAETAKDATNAADVVDKTAEGLTDKQQKVYDKLTEDMDKVNEEKKTLASGEEFGSTATTGTKSGPELMCEKKLADMEEFRSQIKSLPAEDIESFIKLEEDARFNKVFTSEHIVELFELKKEWTSLETVFKQEKVEIEDILKALDDMKSVEKWGIEASKGLIDGLEAIKTAKLAKLAEDFIDPLKSVVKALSKIIKA